MSVEARINAELALLRRHYDAVEHIEASGLHWFRVATVRTAPNWSSDTTEVAFLGYTGSSWHRTVWVLRARGVDVRRLSPGRAARVTPTTLCRHLALLVLVPRKLAANSRCHDRLKPLGLGAQFRQAL